MSKSSRCFYDNSISSFIMESDDVVYSKLDQKYHGLALTTTRDAWRYEISFMHKAVRGGRKGPLSGRLKRAKIGRIKKTI